MTNRRWFDVALGVANADFVGVLDEMTVSPVRAYSTRKLRAAYSGDAIRVRRSSDNAEADIGFTPSGRLDETALLSHVGAGDGFIRTWYDQSTLGLDAFQTTQANQPRIVSSGTIDKKNSRPTIVRSSSNTELQITTTNLLNNVSATSVNVVAFYPSSPSFDFLPFLVFVGIGSSSYPTRFGLTPNPSSPPYNRLAVVVRRLDTDPLTTKSSSTHSNTTAAGALFVETGIVDHSTALTSHYFNNVEDLAPTGTGLGTGTTSSTDPFRAGFFSRPINTFTVPIDTTISEAIIFEVALGSTDRNTLETNQIAYYGI